MLSDLDWGTLSRAKTNESKVMRHNKDEKKKMLKQRKLKINWKYETCAVPGSRNTVAHEEADVCLPFKLL